MRVNSLVVSGVAFKSNYSLRMTALPSPSPPHSLPFHCSPHHSSYRKRCAQESRRTLQAPTWSPSHPGIHLNSATVRTLLLNQIKLNTIELITADLNSISLPLSSANSPAEGGGAMPLDGSDGSDREKPLEQLSCSCVVNIKA